MKTITIRRAGGRAANGWIIHTANSGNQTLEFTLGPGEYLMYEKWYGKTTRKKINVD